MDQRVFRLLIAATVSGVVGLSLASASVAGGGGDLFAVDSSGTGTGLPATVDGVQTTSSFVSGVSWGFRLRNFTGNDVSNPTISVGTGYAPSQLELGYDYGTPVTSVPVIFAQPNLAAGQEFDGVISDFYGPPNWVDAIPVTFSPGCNWTRTVAPLQVPVGGGTQTVVASVYCADPAVRELSVHFGVDLPGVTVVSASGPSNLDQGEQLSGPFGDIGSLSISKGGFAWDLQAIQTGKSYTFSATFQVPNPFGIEFPQKPGVTAFETVPLPSPCSAGCGPMSSVTIADPTLDGPSPGSGAVTFSVGDATQSWSTRAERSHKFDFGGTFSQPLVYAGPRSGTVGHEVTLEASFSGYLGAFGEPVTFTLGSQSCTVATGTVTNAFGDQGAVCTLRLHQPPGQYTATASFAGSVVRYPSSASSPFAILTPARAGTHP